MKGKSVRSGYRYAVAVMCFAIIFIGLGFGSSTKSLFPDEIAKDLGTERSLVSIGESCRYIATAIVNLFFGFFIARFGAKKLVCAGFVSLSAAMVCYAYAENLFMIYLGGTLLGVGFSWVGTTIVGYLIALWFPEKKGVVMGIVLAANGVGGAIAVEIAGAFINPEVIGSYRASYKMIAIVFAVTLLLLLILYRERQPTETQSANAGKKRGRDWDGAEFSVLKSKFYFWGALVCIFFSGFIIQGTSGIAAMHYKDIGFDYSKVKALISFGSLLLAGSKFLTGFFYDKFGLRVASGICTALAVLSSFILAATDGNDSTALVLAIVFTVAVHCAMPLETIMLPIYASDLCGRRSYGKALGLFSSVNTAGYAVSSPVMNLSYDIFGTYKPALLITGFVMTCVLILLQFVISSSSKHKREIEA